MKQEPEHYGFRRTHYNDRTEFYSRREHIVSKISPQNENIDNTEKLNPDHKKIVSIKENPTQNSQFETRNKTAKKKKKKKKENNSKPYAFIIGNSMVTDGYVLMNSINHDFIVKARVFPVARLLI